jgi:hypothetical protein
VVSLSRCSGIAFCSLRSIRLHECSPLRSVSSPREPDLFIQWGDAYTPSYLSILSVRLNCDAVSCFLAKAGTISALGEDTVGAA